MTERDSGSEGGREGVKESQFLTSFSFSTSGIRKGKKGNTCSRSVNRDDQGAVDQTSVGANWTLKERIKGVSCDISQLPHGSFHLVFTYVDNCMFAKYHRMGLCSS